jgi:hypothetical protein
MVLSFFQFVILLLLLFLMFGDFKNLSHNLKKFNTFFSNKEVTKLGDHKKQEKRDLNP